MDMGVGPGKHTLERGAGGVRQGRPDGENRSEQSPQQTAGAQRPWGAWGDSVDTNMAVIPAEG